MEVSRSVEKFVKVRAIYISFFEMLSVWNFQCVEGRKSIYGNSLLVIKRRELPCLRGSKFVMK